MMFPSVLLIPARFFAGLLVAAVAVAASAESGPRQPHARPNVVLILTDDQRYDELGCAGHPVIKTPHIDALAATGVRFERAFATSPVCAPSRATLISGQWQRHNTVGFGRHRAFSRAQWDQSLFAVLRRAGYFTGLVGKSNIMGLRQDEVDYYCGSDDTAQGFYPHEHSRETRFLFGGAKARTQVEVFAEAVDDFLGVDRGFFERSDPGLQRYLGRRPADKPFFLYVPFEVPHGTGTRTMELRPGDDPLYRTAYRDVGDALPVFPRNYLSWEQWRRPKLPGHVYSGEQGPTYGWHFSRDGLREHQIRTAQTLSGVDRFVGQLQDKLRALGLLENTIFIFTSDHGLMHGEWGYGGKALLYEPSIRIPLIVHDPRLKGRGGLVSQELVVMPDLAPTILDLCGLQVPAAMQGRSLAPLLRGEAVAWRDDFFAENLFVSQNYPVVHGVRGKRWKYLRYWPTQPVPSDYRLLLNLGLHGEPPVFEELYDLENDPDENRNLARDPAHAERLELMRRRCTELQREALGRDPNAPLPSQTWENWRTEMKAFYGLFES
jgi:arylsulfatase A-like enzyme